MNEQLKFYKGFESDLPKDNIEPGGLYHCTDTGNTYRGTDTNTLELFSSATGKIIYDNNGNKNSIFDSDISCFQGDIYVNGTDLENKNTQKVATEQYVKDLLGIKEEFSVSGEVVKFDLDVEPGTELNVVSKIHRDSTWGESNKLVLHQVSGDNFVDLTDYLGGAGKVFENNGLTATVNADSTLTVTGTNTSTGWTNVFKITDFNSDYSKRVYPAGNYKIPSGLTINIRAAQYPGNVTITGLTGNLSNRFVAPQPFRVVGYFYAVAGGKTVDVTIPFGLFYNGSIPETGYEYVGNVYTATFDQDVYEGEYNWTTGELKDADGNTVAYYESQSIERLSGVNYFWTGFGENTISNVSENNLEKVVIRLGEIAPEETVPSICDFTLMPTTPQVTYCLHDAKVHNGGVFNKHEIPLITTKGTVSVVNSDGEVTTEKYVDALINWQGVSDLLTNKGVHKVWSEKFYFTKEPVLQEDFTDINNALYTFEFTEEDFQNTGLPAKLDNIPIVSPCFYTGTDAANRLNARVWGGGIFPATLSWDASSGKYIFKVRGVYPGLIMAQLTGYSKGYFHYQLETPYDEAATVAMGISSGDTVMFTVDDSNWKTYLDGELYKDSESLVIMETNATPTGFVHIPRNAADACDGMINAARMLNNAGSAGGDATVQDYSWIGAGDGVTNYTSQIQNKLDILHSTTNGGTIYLGPGTYKINNSLIVYGNTRIIGDGQTVIEQTADNTHAVVWSGSNIVMRDLTIKLSGACTELTACIFINSYNTDNGKRDEKYPINSYVWDCSVNNVTLSGKYSLSWESNYQYLSEEALNYRGIGIFSKWLFFNFFDCDGLKCKHLYAGIYHGGGSNNFRIFATECRLAVYASGGNNRYEIKGHTYYGTDIEGNIFGATDYVVYTEGEHDIFDIAGFYDTQHTKAEIYFAPLSMSNLCYLGAPMTELSNVASETVKTHTRYFNYGRGNEVVEFLKKTYFTVGNSQHDITGQNNPNALLNPVINNALAGAGVWGNISSNIVWDEEELSLSEVCRYPREPSKKQMAAHINSITSSRAPSVENPIEIIIDINNRPIYNYLGLWIQFDHRYIAQDMTISYEYGDKYTYEKTITNNMEPTVYWLRHQGETCEIRRIKISITKALKIPDLEYRGAGYDHYTIDYNLDELIGIVNIGIPQNDICGRTFLGECGGSLYGNVDMHQNTLKNLPNPVDDGDAISKAYLEERLSELKLNGGGVDFSIIRVLESDPTEPQEGQMWILKTTVKKLTIPVIELGNVGENSIAIKLSNASFDGNGDVVTAYKVYVNGVLNKTTTIFAGGTCVIDGLSPETKYQISVRGVKDTVLSGASNTLIATTEESTQKGETTIVIGITSAAASGNINLATWAGNVRATAVYTTGKKACVNQQSDEVYYPIPVPADATSITVVCPGMQYGYNGWNLATNTYSYDVDSGWQASGTTYTFNAGAAEYATINFNKGSSNITEAELANITITFNTNSEPEVPDEPEPVIPERKIVIGFSCLNNNGNINLSTARGNTRASTLYTTGEKACINTSTNEVYYPVPLHADATSVTVVCPGMKFGYNGWKLSNNAYSYTVDSGWRESGSTYSFDAGAADYYSIIFESLNSADLTETDIANITIAFTGEIEAPGPEYNASSVMILLGTNVGNSGAHGINLNPTSEDKVSRAISLYSNGVQAVTNQYDGNTYYPIPVPVDAISITVVCPGMKFGFDGWNLINGVYSYDVNSGWKSSGATYSFEAGAAEYATIGLSKLDGSAMTEADVANVTITFNTNSEPEADNTSSIMVVPRHTVGESKNNDIGVTMVDSPARACVVATSGSVPIPSTLGGVQYYMIKVPGNVTSCTVTCPGLMWGFNGWSKQSSGILKYEVDSGWKASGTTYTFNAGAAEYATINFKKGSSGLEEFTENDDVLNEISINFA